jgi:hypothetical protein
MTSESPKPKRTRKPSAAAIKGRPPGVANVDYAGAVAIPPVCPKCKSIDLKVVPGSKSIERPELAGRLANGFEYSGMSWKSMVCQCGQRVKVRFYFPRK